MAQTVIRGTQILNNTVQRQDLDTSTVGQAVVTKLVQGSGITLSSTGADSGTGDVTVSSPDVVSTDAGNIATLGTDNHILVPQSQIWSVRLRSTNILGNSTFEVDQVGCNAASSNTASGARIADRWFLGKGGTMGVTTYAGNNNQVVIPGTSYVITGSQATLQLTTQQTTLGANDFLLFNQNVEGPSWRELRGDVHSISLLLYSTVAPLTFAVALRDMVPTTTKSFVKTITLSTSNVWTLLTLPNLSVFPSGNFSQNPGNIGYNLSVSLACGSTLQTPTPGVWASGNYVGVSGMTNWCANPISTTQFFCAFIQHEPGAQCTTPIDCPFTQNYDDCLRYFCKSYDYGTKPGTATANGAPYFWVPAAQSPLQAISYKKPMAKVPTITAYSTVTGAASAVRDVSAGVDRTINTTFNPGETGFGGFGVATPNSAQAAYQFHYVADIGW